MFRFEMPGLGLLMFHAAAVPGPLMCSVEACTSMVWNDPVPPVFTSVVLGVGPFTTLTWVAPVGVRSMSTVVGPGVSAPA